ncbi:hypothetical protein [Enterovirga rhinocerotis]|uniref:Uncharacterized protein n=1 Tax=Enterovirga rhinocerotis TaxID=1339210 RepID=A0A4R7BWL1_9HYPH|nr:hypothetical protein [Enterovirga rhinocerotis]TDR90298.1 hypothetical protein EV668_3144 [Enterovirga rhinocerotis]
MRTIVITPPGPLITPEAVPGDHVANDAKVAALIQAATEQIDGPTGWLGRALGPQTLELHLTACDVAYGPPGFIYQPLIELLSVKYDDPDGTERTLSAPEDHVRLRSWRVMPATSWPTIADSGHLRIRYRAGYDGDTTGAVPERVKQAIVLGVNNAKSVGAENLFIAEEDVDGVGSTRYVVSPSAGLVIAKTIDQMLSGLRVFA